MIQTTAVIKKWTKVAAAQSDGAMAFANAFDPLAPGVAIRCAVNEPSTAARMSLAARGIEHPRSVMVEGARLRRRGVTAEVGDRLAIVELSSTGRPSGEERWYQIVQVTESGAAGRAGAIDSVRLLITPSGAGV